MKTRLLAGIAGALILPLAACGSSDDSGDGWTFTDDLGTEISLDAEPERLVVQSSMAAALTDLGLGDKIVGTFGPLTNAAGEPDSQVAGLDIDSVEDVTGEGDYGDIDEEAVGTLDPDLIITSAYLEPQLWYMSDESAETLRKKFDIAVVSFDGTNQTEMLDATERLAEALGADLDSPEVTQAHEDFEAASQAVSDLGSQLTESGKTILGASADTDSLYISNPAVSQDLNYWVEELGLPIVVPELEKETDYFETLSWENADKYSGDIILYDDRIGEAGLAIFEQQPVFQLIPGAAADAYVPWTSVYPPSYRAVADTLERLAADLQPYV